MFPRERSSPFTRAGHLQAQVAELVGRDDVRPEARREVLALRRAEPDLHLGALEVACRPVVHDREAADLAALADHDRRLELVVELVRPVGYGISPPGRRSRPGS
jgi:hypothetical protein